jgi:hypothetical protein
MGSKWFNHRRMATQETTMPRSASKSSGPGSLEQFPLA